MTKFRKGDVVTIEGTIDSAFVHDGKTKVRIEPYSEVYANVADLKMVQPVIEVGDSVTYPAGGYKAGEVQAIVDGYCWVKLAAKIGQLTSKDDGLHVIWPIACVNRVDPEPEPEPEIIEAAPSAEGAA